MNPDFHLVTHLQTLDRRIFELDRQIASLPRHIAEIEKALESHNRKLETDRAALAANQKDRKSLERDIQIQEQKTSKLKGQMLEAKTNEQYRAFQNEIEYCEKEIRKAEDRILDLMSESEPLDVNVKKAEASLKEEKRTVEAEKAEARERSAADKAQLEQLQSERKIAMAQLPGPIYAEYERIRKKWHGNAVAEAVDGRCSACQISLRQQFLQDLRKNEQFMFCESCGRFLIFNAPVSFDDQIAAQTGGTRVNMS